MREREREREREKGMFIYLHIRWLSTIIGSLKRKQSRYFSVIT
jgi:hypothetical protein